RRFRRNVANPEAQLRSVLWELERGRDEYVHVPFADQPRAHLRLSWQAHADHTRMARAHLGWLLVLDVREYAAIQPHLDGLVQLGLRHERTRSASQARRGVHHARKIHVREAASCAADVFQSARGLTRGHERAKARRS